MVYIKLLLLLPILIYLAFKDKKDKEISLYGIYGFFGLAGQGKTIAMSKELLDLREKYGDSIYIMTNYCFEGEDFTFNSWKDLLKPYDKPLAIGWDELPNLFNSRDFKNFPLALLTILTQVRKGNGIRIYYTAQRWHFVDKNFRSLSFGCYECRTLFGRYTITRLYDPIDYDNLCSNSDYEKRRKIKPISSKAFIQNETIRNCYDSYKMLESAKSKEYMDRSEIALLNLDLGI